ncbi:MAG: HD domain-containing protein [Candidatus Anstonellales archaeon]
MKISKRTYENNLGIEEALKYLVQEIEKYCDNQKPLITHCTRVAFRLDFYGYDKEVVQAALLHDLLEDTQASIEEIEDKFGEKVARLVSVSTFDKEIEDKEERYKENFNKALRLGSEALAIRASDLVDNSYYYSLVDDPEVYNHLLEKLSYFLKIAKNRIGKEKIYKDLEDRFKVLKKK